MDIKNTTEVIDAIDATVDMVKKVLEDGKVDIKDLPVLMDLVKAIPVYKVAVEGAKDIKDELKDLSQDEIAFLALRMLAIVKKFAK